MTYFLLSLAILSGVIYGKVNADSQDKQAEPVMVSPTISPTATPDPRIENIRSFYKRYSSPLIKHASDIVSISDSYGIDPYLVTAISMAESSGGKHIPAGSFNPFGLACTGSTPCLRFRDYTDAIHTLVATLANHQAYEKWRQTGKMEDLAQVYASDSQKWQEAVIEFIKRMER